jgi:phosphoribosylformylglycinamidine cyclo-ligase
MTRTYRDAGVDIDEWNRALPRIAAAAAGTGNASVLGGVGGFGSLFRFDPTTHPDPVLVASTDGVGTKLRVAQALGRFDTIGIDLVNHCINDIAVSGADPLFFLDYLGVGKLDADRAAEIVGGIADACAAAGVALVGGETAELPGIYASDDFDLAGFIVGVVARAELIDGSAVAAGDAVIGLPSSGLHTNGYSLARRVLPPDTWARTVPGGERSIGETLLEPHRSYLDEIRLLRRAVSVRALAHITGGGWTENVPRTLPAGLGVEIHPGAWAVPPIFTLIQSAGDISDEEMARTFNLGIGLTCVVPSAETDAALAALPEASLVGRVVAVDAGEPRVRFT